jgi:hypothetical protein
MQPAALNNGRALHRSNAFSGDGEDGLFGLFLLDGILLWW